MDTQLARNLIALDNAFYRANAESFSATRSTPWAGWSEMLHDVRGAFGASPSELSVLDLACGNMRLAAFLAESLPKTRILYRGVDASSDLPALARAAALRVTAESRLAPVGPKVTFLHTDVLSELIDGKEPGLDTPSEAGAEAIDGNIRPDLACCFGFMHHVPGLGLRARVLEALAGSVREDGLVVVSFWQFMDDERLAAKARIAMESALADPPFEGFDPALLEPGDHFLGWQDGSTLRYCHHASEDEIDGLVAALSEHGVRELRRFSADGKSGKLNRYVVLMRGAGPRMTAER